MPQTAVTFRTADGLMLEGRVARPDGSPSGVAVLCHPYPPAGGSMSSIVIPRLARALSSAGRAALRFNFRGVGASEGVFSGGVEETADVAGALAFMRSEFPGAPSAVAGWSFGAVVGMNAAIADPELEAYVGIALPLDAGASFALPSLPDVAGWKARRLLVAGDEDSYCRVGTLRDAAARLGSEVHVIQGADHIFTGRLDELAGVVTSFVTGREIAAGPRAAAD